MKNLTSESQLLEAVIKDADIKTPNNFESFIDSMEIVGERMQFHGWIACALMIIFKETGVLISLSYLAGNGISLINEEIKITRETAFVENVQKSPHFKTLRQAVQTAVDNVLKDEHLTDDEVSIAVANRLKCFSESIKTRICLELVTEKLPYVKYWLSREIEAE